MTNRGEPKIVPGSGKDWTKITFKPDLAKFGMSELTDDTIALMKKRVYDVAGCCPSVKVCIWLLCGTVFCCKQCTTSKGSCSYTPFCVFLVRNTLPTLSL